MVRRRQCSHSLFRPLLDWLFLLPISVEHLRSHYSDFPRCSESQPHGTVVDLHHHDLDVVAELHDAIRLDRQNQQDSLPSLVKKQRGEMSKNDHVPPSRVWLVLGLFGLFCRPRGIDHLATLIKKARRTMYKTARELFFLQVAPLDCLVAACTGPVKSLFRLSLVLSMPRFQQQEPDKRRKKREQAASAERQAVGRNRHRGNPFRGDVGRDT